MKYYFIDNRKIGIVTVSGTTTSIAATGTATVHYKQYNAELTADNSEPTFNSRYHMALVYGALERITGQKRFNRIFEEYKQRGRSSNNPTKPREIRTYQF